MATRTIALTPELRAALSVAMAHPSEWGEEEHLALRHNVEEVFFSDVVPMFVVEQASQYDDGDLLVEGFWPDVPTTFILAGGGRLTGLLRIAAGGNVSLDAHPELAALLPA